MFAKLTNNLIIILWKYFGSEIKTQARKSKVILNSLLFRLLTFFLFQLSKQDCRGKDRSEGMPEGSFAFDSDSDPFKFTPASNGHSPKKSNYSAEFDKFAYHSPEHAPHYEIDTKLQGERSAGEMSVSCLKTPLIDFKSEDKSDLKSDTSFSITDISDLKSEFKDSVLEANPKSCHTRELPNKSYFTIIKQEYDNTENQSVTASPSKFTKTAVSSSEKPDMLPGETDKLVQFPSSSVQMSLSAPSLSDIKLPASSSSYPGFYCPTLLNTSPSIASSATVLSSASLSSSILPPSFPPAFTSTLSTVSMPSSTEQPSSLVSTPSTSSSHLACLQSPASLAPPLACVATSVPTQDTSATSSYSIPDAKSDTTSDTCDPETRQKTPSSEQPSSKLYRGKLSFFKQAISQEISTMQETERLAKVQQEIMKNDPVPTVSRTETGPLSEIKTEEKSSVLQVEKSVSSNFAVTAPSLPVECEKECHTFNDKVNPNNPPVTPDKVRPSSKSQSPEKLTAVSKDLPTNVVRKAIKRPITAQIIHSSPLLTHKQALHKSNTTPTKKTSRVVHSINANPIPVMMNGHKVNVVKIEKHQVSPISQANHKDVPVFKLSSEQQALGLGQQNTYPIAFTDYLKVQQQKQAWKRKISSSECSLLESQSKKKARGNIVSPTHAITFTSSPTKSYSPGPTTEIVKVNHSVLNKNLHVEHKPTSGKLPESKSTVPTNHKQSIQIVRGKALVKPANNKKTIHKHANPVKCKKSSSHNSISKAKKTLQNKILSHAETKSSFKVQSRPPVDIKLSTSPQQSPKKSVVSKNEPSLPCVKSVLRPLNPLSSSLPDTNEANNSTTIPDPTAQAPSQFMPHNSDSTNKLATEPSTQKATPKIHVAAEATSFKLQSENLINEKTAAIPISLNRCENKEDPSPTSMDNSKDPKPDPPQGNSIIKTEGVPTPPMSTLSDPKHFIKVEACPDGEATVVRLDMEKFDELNVHQQNLIVDYFFEITFGETNGVADHVMGIISNGAREMPNVFNFLVENAPGLKINHQILGKKDITNCTIEEYYDKIKKNHSKCIYHEGGMQHVSLVGTKSEESGSYFPELIQMMESNPFFEVTLPWGTLSRYHGLEPSLSNDGPIFWVRPGEQFLQSTSGSRNHKGYRLLKNRETLVADRTTPHADHSWEDGKIMMTTAAAAFLQPVEITDEESVVMDKSLKDVIAFDAANFYQLAEELQLDLYEPPMTQCDIWIEDAKLNQLRESGVKFSRIRLKANDMYFIPRNVIHQFKTVAACLSVAWHVRLKQYYDDH